MPHFRLHLLFVFCIGLFACTSSNPQISVLGVKAPKPGTRIVKVFVEVLNPTNQAFSLERMEYRFVAEDWIDASGKVLVKRNVAPNGKAIIELRVPLKENVPLEAIGVLYQLEARLIGFVDKGERSWKVQAKGELNARAGAPIQVAARP